MNSPAKLRLRRLLLAAVLPVILAACSRAELVYENADWLVYRWAIKLVDASAEQREAWRGRFDELLATHRQQLLPDVVALLRQIEAEAERGLSAERLDCLVARTDALYRDHARLFVPLAVDILAELSPDQIDHLAEQLAERNSDYREEYLAADPAERRAERAERYVERIERWTGPLDDGQLQMVTDAIGAMPETTGAWLEYRTARQKALLRLLRAGAGRPQLTAFLTAWWVDFEGRPAQLGTDVIEVRRRSIALAVAIDGALVPNQRSRFIDRVADLSSSLGNAMTVAAAQPAIAGPRCG
jgi:hypothetical protein